ncbi:hypothetical protein JL108_15080 [Aeromicrobium sp. YIM 150415]|uniref:WXG100 family type VII secretion target n=1 Tax=Aeromicrobium sp. YIM 150415 TaxID=2803912 RepID=UPI001962859F|nr:hypothetical protein [Aeromicrobium sp. YIM 150415]MBM9464777.1 hypothetical protein [Aeromicrobium sp. YIM 150415]
MTSPDVPHRDVISERLTELESELRELRVHWSSTATEAYQSALGQWRSAAADLSLLLEQEPSPTDEGDDASVADEAPLPQRTYLHWA